MSKKTLKNTKDQNEECFESQLKLLRIHGLWPAKNSTHRIELPHLFRRLILNGLVICLVTCAVTHLAMKFVLDTNEDVTDDLVVCFAFSFFVYVFFIFTLNQNKIIKFVNDLRDFTEYGKPAGLEKLIKRQKKYTYAIYVYCQLGAVIYGYVSYSLTRNCNKTSHVNAATCGMTVPIYIPFELDNRVKLGIIVFELIIVLYQLLLPGLIGTYLMIAMMELIALRIRHIRTTICTLPKLKSYKERRGTLIYCIRYHNAVIGFEKSLAECFGKANAVHLFLSAIIMGILNYKIYYKMEAKDIIHLLGWILSMILLCNSGQGLLNESTGLTTQIYFLPWYNFEKPLQRIIQLFIMRSQSPIKVEAGVFYSYSNELLLKIFQSSFSYMAVLNHFTSSTSAKGSSKGVLSN